LLEQYRIARDLQVGGAFFTCDYDEAILDGAAGCLDEFLYVGPLFVVLGFNT
jgi:hypothetical protein